MDGERVTICIPREGPLLVRLRLDVTGHFAVLHEFIRGPDDAIGALEADGRIVEGDVLEAINDVCLIGRSLEEILLQISRVSRESDSFVKELTFLKPQSFSKDTDVMDTSNAPPEYSEVNQLHLTPENDIIPDNSLMTSTSTLPAAQKTLHRYQTLLTGELINEGRLRYLASKGLPDKLGLRGVIWRLLLRYLPLDTGMWTQSLALRRQDYSDLCIEYIQASSDESVVYSPSSGTPKGPQPRVLLTDNDDPLRVTDADAWKCYFENISLMEEVQKDVVRTHPDISFFHIDPSCAVQAAMQRILYIYAKVTPAVRYVQGMNELIGTLYYVFASDENEEWAIHAEADTFHCFTLLIAGMEDMFIRQKDSSDSGIIAHLNQFVHLVRIHDVEVHDLLTTQGIDPAFYGLRWLTTILSREFNLPDTIRLWDTLLADTNRNEFLSYICCSMILEQRERLLKGDFGENLGLLQEYPEVDIPRLLNDATSLRSKDFMKRSRPLRGKGDRTTGTEDSDCSFDDSTQDETPQQRLMSTIKSAADAAGHTISDLKSSVGSRLLGVRALLAEGRESLSEKVGNINFRQIFSKLPVKAGVQSGSTEYTK